jgi:hypothetical protein
MTVAVAARALTALVAQPAEELVDLGVESLLEQALGTLADDPLDRVVGSGNRCSRGQNLVPWPPAEPRGGRV